MRRGTPSAELFGNLLKGIRTTRLDLSMRKVADKIGVKAATISQIEKGQRALKEPKIALWADALDVKEEDLHHLWMLCQGLIRSDLNQYVFYKDVTYVDDSESLKFLTLRIANVLRHLLPDKTIKVFLATSTSMPYVVFHPTYRVEIPLLEKPTPIVRKRGKSVNANDLGDLILKLSGPERERVRGYIEAIIESLKET